MNSDNLICFYRENGAYGEFSNWKEAPFQYAGKKYSSALQFLMYQKALLFGQRQLAQKIMNENDQQEIKKLGNTKFEGYRDMLWDVICEGIAMRGIRAKFQQNPEMADLLLGTEDKVLAFSTPLDNNWGTGVAVTSPDAADVFRWKGKNRLGKLLMETRDNLRLWELVYGKLLPYEDIKNAAALPVFGLLPGELATNPSYFKAIQTYVLSLPDQHAKDTFFWTEKIGRMDTNQLSLPKAGFLEMKQEIYDIARLKDAIDQKTRPVKNVNI